MKYLKRRGVWFAVALSSLLVILGPGLSQVRGQSSYAPVDIKETFASIMSRMTQAKPEIQKRHADLLNERYDLSNRPVQGVTMSRGKPVQEGVRAKLPAGVTWDALAAMSPDEIREKNLFPKGFYPLPHPNHPEGGMLFPKFEIDEIKKQEGRDLTRFDLDYRPARSLPARVSGPHLPDHPPRSRRRVPGQAGDHRQLLRAVQRAPEPQAARRAPVAGDALPPAAVQPDRGSPLRETRAAAWPASIATPTATRTPPRIWSATSVPRSSATASTRRRCAA